MPLPVPHVTLLTGGGHEDGAQAVGNREAAAEFLITYEVLADLRRCHPLDSAIQELFLWRAIRREYIATSKRTDEGQQGDVR
jgi:hypothetical protein